MPSKNEYIFYRKKYYGSLPCCNTILRIFNESWNKAIKEAEKHLGNN
jgi:hypothetical protein